MNQFSKRTLCILATAGVAVASGLAAAQTAQIPSTLVSASDSPSLSEQVWQNALSNRNEDAFEPLNSIQPDASPELVDLRESWDALRVNLAKREQQRAEQIQKANEELETALTERAEKAAAGDPVTMAISNALKAAVTLHELSLDPEQVLTDARIVDLISRADIEARTAESIGDLLNANELFFRLNTLLERDGRYRDDVKRVTTRLTMIRSYVPEKFWDMRNEKRVKDGEDPLPPFNGLGEDYRNRLDGVTARMVLGAINRSATQHIERVALAEILIGGLKSTRTFVTTKALAEEFAGLSDPVQVDAMLRFLDEREQAITEKNNRVTTNDLFNLVDDMRRLNRSTVKLPETALLHEYGNGAMSVLDDYSAIIWPDEMKRFRRMTEGEFQGVGIQIQFDEDTQMIKVVTPLEGTPAQRAGIRAGDLIKRINGKSAIGISLGQAVELITGPQGTKVTVTVERAGEDLDKDLVRAVIPLVSVKGWRKTGPADDAWDWFIDPEHGIGYVRLTGFQDATTDELHRALGHMKDRGLKAVILDLRFNPGGLLGQAVGVSNTFIENGLIVSTEGAGRDSREVARPSGLRVQNMPIVVLINEGSASASEIVSGAIRHYADVGLLDAVLVGERSFGKGSVQNVWPLDLAQSAAMKLTTQYYKLPDGRIIHKKPGATLWGVEPHVRVDMLPEQISESLTTRQDADVVPLDEQDRQAMDERPDPRKLIDDGLDVQLQTALLLLRTKLAGLTPQHVSRENELLPAIP